MRNTVVTPPASEPITLAEAKDYLRVTHSHEDVLITSQLKAARKLCENAVRMAFITQIRQTVYTLPRYCEDNSYFLSAQIDDPDRINSGISLLGKPIGAISTFEVYRDSSSRTAVSSSAYRVDPDAHLIEWVPEFFIPLLSNNRYLRIVYSCGMALNDFVAAYPDILEAIKITTAVLYDERGYSKQGLPPAAWQFLSPYWTSVTYGRG